MIAGIYSPTIVTTSPRGIIGGRPSALLGFMQARAALTSGPDTEVLKSLDDFTRDYYDVSPAMHSASVAAASSDVL
jgi:hypothetical protein